MNALVFGIALRHRRDTVEALRKHEQAWSRHGTYANENYAARFSADIEAFAARSANGRRTRARSVPSRRRKARGEPLARS
jgi:hypothetical protein